MRHQLTNGRRLHPLDPPQLPSGVIHNPLANERAIHHNLDGIPSLEVPRDSHDPHGQKARTLLAKNPRRPIVDRHGPTARLRVAQPQLEARRPPLSEQRTQCPGSRPPPHETGCPAASRRTPPSRFRPPSPSRQPRPCCASRPSRTATSGRRCRTRPAPRSHRRARPARHRGYGADPPCGRPAVSVSSTSSARRAAAPPAPRGSRCRRR